jgi:SAM-dependent methyltransferase
VGAADGSLLAALGAKTGLSGRACVVDDDGRVAAQAAATAERTGVLVEAQAIADDRIPFEDAAFDLVVVASAGRLARASGSSGPLLAELARVLRPGGRVVALVPVEAKGRLDAEAVGRETGVTAAVEALTAGGLRGARVLAATGGLAYVEAANPRD